METIPTTLKSNCCFFRPIVGSLFADKIWRSAPNHAPQPSSSSIIPARGIAGKCRTDEGSIRPKHRDGRESDLRKAGDLVGEGQARKLFVLTDDEMDGMGWPVATQPNNRQGTISRTRANLPELAPAEC